MNPTPAADPRPPRRVAILQSNYIPWKGYFDIIHGVDLFVFYDDVAYTLHDWRNRNRIKVAGGPTWLTIPNHGRHDQRIDEVEIDDPRWQAKHWRSIEQAYGKTAHFGRYRDYFQHVYLGQTWTSLSRLNQSLITHIAHDFLGLATSFDDAARYGAQGRRLERLLDLVARTGATSYLSGPAARDYIDPRRFADIGVELRWQDYSGYPEYPQRFPPFEHGVSILDLLFNTGPDAPEYIWGRHRRRAGAA
jgi:hypothetical protein